MDREMRRNDRALSGEQAWEIIKKGAYGVLSVVGDDGCPYGVPLHYVCLDGQICFHSTSGESHKADSLARCDRVSFTVLEMEDEVKGKSVVIFGRVEKASGQKEAIVTAIVEKFVPDFAWEKAKLGITPSLPSLEAYALTVDGISGKWIDKPEGK